MNCKITEIDLLIDKDFRESNSVIETTFENLYKILKYRQKMKPHFKDLKSFDGMIPELWSKTNESVKIWVGLFDDSYYIYIHMAIRANIDTKKCHFFYHAKLLRPTLHVKTYHNFILRRDIWMSFTWNIICYLMLYSRSNRRI